MNATTFKTKLTDVALTQLATLTVETLLETPITHWVEEQRVVRLMRAVLTGWLESDQSMPAFTRLTERAINDLAGRQETLHRVLSGELQQALRTLVSRPFSPDRALVLSLIDQDPTRALVRRLLLDVILDFGRKLSAPVSGVAKGLGSLAKLATDTVKARSGGLGSLVGAVSGEVERQLEKRATEFVDAAMGGIFGQIADALCDPGRAHEAAQMRLAMFDAAMKLTLKQLSREFMNADLPGTAELLRDSLRTWLAGAEADRQLTSLAAWVLSSMPSLREGLTQWGLLEQARALAIEQLGARMKDVVATPAFAQWLESL